MPASIQVRFVGVLGFLQRSVQAFPDLQFDPLAFYKVRENILTTTPAGLRQADLYNAQSDSIELALTANPALTPKAYPWSRHGCPTLNALTGPQNVNTTVTAYQVRSHKRHLWATCTAPPAQS